MVTLSHQALARMTVAQRDAIVRLSDMRHTMRVTTAFDLPDGWLSFEQAYEGTATTIYGGIDPEGVAST